MAADIERKHRCLLTKSKIHRLPAPEYNPHRCQKALYFMYNLRVLVKKYGNYPYHTFNKLNLHFTHTYTYACIHICILKHTHTHLRNRNSTGGEPLSWPPFRSCFSMVGLVAPHTTGLVVGDAGK